ncbi:MAG: hypothetical protein KF823_05485 [Xanthomonadales bacterium]|nr:hypothetical protein [Xanthomonadales bacterium]
MNTLATCIALAASVLLAHTALADDGSASGRFQAAGELRTVADGMAVRDGRNVRIVFSDQAFDRVAFAADGKYDLWDFMDHPGNSLQLTVDPEGGFLWSWSTMSGGSTISGSSNDGLSLENAGADRIKGRWQDEGGHAVQFDLPVLPQEVPRAGQPLAADGGEPGAAFRAMLEAIHGGDIEGMINYSARDQAEQLRAAVASGEAAQVLEMAKAFTPGVDGLAIQGGTVDGERAWVEFTGRDATGAIRGTAVMLRIDERWRMDAINTTSTSD